MCAVAIPEQIVAHAAEGLAVDFLAGGLVALADKPRPGQAIAYVDWSSMEFMVAASLSNDPVMLDFYRGGDPYLAFAKRVGAATADANKRTHGPLRDRYKTGLLAIQYGAQAETLAGRLGISRLRRPRDGRAASASCLASTGAGPMTGWRTHSIAGLMWTPLGWKCRTGVIEFNERSIQNFPVQATAAEIFRIAAIWATRHGLGLRAPVHDALLIEAPIERIEADVALLQELMRRASRVVLDPHELRTDAVIIRYPERYSDPRGEAIWTDVLALLADYRRQQAAARSA